MLNKIPEEVHLDPCLSCNVYIDRELGPHCDECQPQIDVDLALAEIMSAIEILKKSSHKELNHRKKQLSFFAKELTFLLEKTFTRQ